MININCDLVLVVLGEIIGGKDFTNSYTSGKYDLLLLFLLLLLQWLYCAMQTFISVLNGLLPVVASTKFAVYLNSCISYISYLYLVFLAKLYTGKIFQIHIHLYCNICKFITFILQLRHPRCVLTLPTFICLLFTAHYILTTQDQITPRPTTAFGSTYATHSLSHRRLTALVTPYVRDHC